MVAESSRMVCWKFSMRTADPHSRIYPTAPLKTKQILDMPITLMISTRYQSWAFHRNKWKITHSCLVPCTFALNGTSHLCRYLWERWRRPNILLPYWNGCSNLHTPSMMCRSSMANFFMPTGYTKRSSLSHKIGSYAIHWLWPSIFQP